MTDNIRERLKNQGVGFTRDTAILQAQRLKAGRLKTVKKSAPKKQPVLPKTVLNQVRDSMRDADRGLGSLYFEAHVFTENAVIHQLVERNEFIGFGGHLIFRASKLERVKKQLEDFVADLKRSGVVVTRYRIVEAMIDSNNFDTLKLL